MILGHLPTKTTVDFKEATAYDDETQRAQSLKLLKLRVLNCSIFFESMPSNTVMTGLGGYEMNNVRNPRYIFQQYANPLLMQANPN